jgi:hypothetical protein
METPRKPRVPKAGEPLPPMTLLKRLPQQHRETILLWLEDKPQEEVATLVERNFDISCSPESWPSTLSRFRAWALRLPQTEAANDFAEFLQERLQSSPNLPVDQIYAWTVETLTVIADKMSRETPALIASGFFLKLAKELRALDSLGLAKEKWRAERQKKLEQAFDALGEELKGNAAALAAYDAMREALSK